MKGVKYKCIAMEEKVLDTDSIYIFSYVSKTPMRLPRALSGKSAKSSEGEPPISHRYLKEMPTCMCLKNSKRFFFFDLDVIIH